MTKIFVIVVSIPGKGFTEEDRNVVLGCVSRENLEGFGLEIGVGNPMPSFLKHMCRDPNAVVYLDEADVFQSKEEFVRRHGPKKRERRR